MKHFTKLAAAGVIAASAALTTTDADALPFSLSGDFTIEAYNYNPNGASDGVRSDQSQATEANFLNISGATLDPLIGTVNEFDTFTYSGVLDFRQGHTAESATTTVSDWLNTSPDAPAGLSGLDSDFAGAMLSAGGGTGDNNQGTPFTTTTLFKITASSLNISDLANLWDVNHDDGVTFFGSGTSTVASVGPNSEENTTLNGLLSGGVSDFTLYYAAANGNPSILEVNAVPLPAAAWLLIFASGGLIAAKRRQIKKAA